MTGNFLMLKPQEVVRDRILSRAKTSRAGKRTRNLLMPKLQKLRGGKSASSTFFLCIHTQLPHVPCLFVCRTANAWKRSLPAVTSPSPWNPCTPWTTPTWSRPTDTSPCTRTPPWVTPAPTPARTCWRTLLATL